MLIWFQDGLLLAVGNKRAPCGDRI